MLQEAYKCLEGELIVHTSSVIRLFQGLHFVLGKNITIGSEDVKLLHFHAPGDNQLSPKAVPIKLGTAFLEGTNICAIGPDINLGLQVMRLDKILSGGQVLFRSIGGLHNNDPFQIVIVLLFREPN